MVQLAPQWENWNKYFRPNFFVCFSGLASFELLRTCLSRGNNTHCCATWISGVRGEADNLLNDFLLMFCITNWFGSNKTLSHRWPAVLFELFGSSFTFCFAINSKFWAFSARCGNYPKLDPNLVSNKETFYFERKVDKSEHYFQHLTMLCAI